MKVIQIQSQLQRLAVSMFACGMLLGEQPKAAPQPAPDEAIRQYLMSHPEVILQSLKGYQVRQKQANQERARHAVIAAHEELVNDVASPSAGNPKGLAVVEFFDYQCGYCKKVNPVLTELLKTNPNVRVVFKELPILGPDSMLGSKASLAAKKQGAYLRFHDALMAASEPVTMEMIEKTATQLGLNVARLKADMKSPEIDEAIVRNSELAEKLNVRATPAFVIGSEVVAGAVDAGRLAKLVEAEAAVLTTKK